MMVPRVRRRSGPAACAQKNGAFKFVSSEASQTVLRRRNNARRQKIRRAVHQNVEPPKLLPCFIEQALDVGDAAKIRRNGHRTPSQLFNFCNRARGLRSRRAVVNHHVRALFRQAHCHCPSEPFGRAGDHSHTSIERSFHGVQKGNTFAAVVE